MKGPPEMVSAAAILACVLTIPTFLQMTGESIKEGSKRTSPEVYESTLLFVKIFKHC
jgi:hypothetical protein